MRRNVCALRMMHTRYRWMRPRGETRVGTQAPPLRFRLGGLRVGRLMSFGQIARGRLVSFGRITRECRMAFDGLCMMLGPVV